MKKTLAIFAILLMAFSCLAFAEDVPPPAVPTPPPSEPTPPPTEPTPPPTEPTPPPEEPRDEPMPPVEGPVTPPGEQPVPPPVPGGPGAPGSGGQPSQPAMCYLNGKEIPCDQMPKPEDRPPQPGDQPRSDDRPPQTGPGSGGCWVGEQQVPCPGEGPRLPQGCKEIIEPNGMRRVDCGSQPRAPDQTTCTPGPDRERIEKECAAKGGRTITKNLDSSRGCGIVDCVFGGDSGGNFMPDQQQNCPGPEELTKKEEDCKSMGLNPKRMRSNCEYVQCEDPNKQQSMCPDVSLERVKAKEQCNANGGTMVDEFDAYGCSIPKCISSGQQCQNNVPQEAYFKCEDQGGKLVVNTDENGCITFSKCVMRGQEGVQAEDELDEVPHAAKLLQVALKLESIKISFDQMSKQISAIADYYDNEGDAANADRFRRAAGMFESAKKQIDGVKEELKLGVRGMSVEQIIDIKHKIRQISDVVMEDALYVILGGEATGVAVTEETTSEEMPNFMPAATNDCGSNGDCFAKALRICFAGAAVSPDRNVNLKITGLENGACMVEGRANTPEGDKSLECKFVDYATDQLNAENFMKYCDGSYVDYVKETMSGNLPQTTQNQQQFTKEQAFQGQMMGCEKVDKGINKKGVCGNECCENRFGESNYNCPQDCMASQQQQVGQQPFVERAQQVFQQGGMGGCEDEMSGQSPKDVCGNDCCEPGESPENCPKDCNAMQGQPMNDEGRFFNEQRGPMQPNNNRYIESKPVQGIQEIPREEWRQPPPVESSSDGGIVTGAVVAFDLLKEFLGR
ncbi:MAG: hypothetical protein V1734_02990 [Nanoarchaeota archaeon]